MLTPYEKELMDKRFAEQMLAQKEENELLRQQVTELEEKLAKANESKELDSFEEYYLVNNIEAARVRDIEYNSEEDECVIWFEEDGEKIVLWADWFESFEPKVGGYVVKLMDEYYYFSKRYFELYFTKVPF